MRTRTQLRQLVARQFRPMPFLSATSSGGTNTTLTDVDELGKFADNKLRGAWHYVSGTAPEDLQIVSNVQSTGVTTFRPTSDISGASTYEVLPFSATDIHVALDDAIDFCYDQGWLWREFNMRHLVAGSPIYNGTPNYWSTSTQLHGWTGSAGTHTQQKATEAYVPFGDHNIVFSAAPQTLTLDADYRRYLLPLRRFSITIHAFCLGSTASEIRGQILVDGSVVGSTPFHSGNGTWEVVTSDDIVISDGANEISVRWDVAGVAGTPTGNSLWLTDGPHIYEYPFPIALVQDGPQSIYSSFTNVDEDNLVVDTRFSQRPLVNWDIHRFRNVQGVDSAMLKFEGAMPRNGHQLFMPCVAPLTKPTTDSDNVEVSEQDSLLLAKVAASALIKRQNWMGSASLRDRGTDMLRELEIEVAQLIRGRGVRDKGVAPLSAGW